MAVCGHLSAETMNGDDHFTSSTGHRHIHIHSPGSTGSVSWDWMVASGDATGVICIFKGNADGVIGNGKASVRATLRSAGAITRILFSSNYHGCRVGPPDTGKWDREYVAIGTEYGSIVVLDVNSGKPAFRQERGHRSRVTSLAFIDTTKVVSGSDKEDNVNVWDIQSASASKTSGQCIKVLGKPTPPGGRPPVAELDIRTSSNFGFTSCVKVVHGLITVASTGKEHIITAYLTTIYIVLYVHHIFKFCR